MIRYATIPKTLSAQCATATAPVRCVWPPEERICAIARYYQQQGLRIRWDSHQRTLVADIKP